MPSFNFFELLVLKKKGVMFRPHIGHGGHLGHVNKTIYSTWAEGTLGELIV